MDSDLELRFGADASGAVEGGQQAKGAVAGVADAVKLLVGGLLELGGAATGSFRQIKSGAAEAAGAVKGTAESVTELREALSGIGEALLAAFAVEQLAEFAKKMAETAETALHTAQTFGLTVGQVQQMNAEAALFGVKGEVMATAMQRLDKSFQAAKEGSKLQGEAYQKLGIDINGTYTQTELLNTAMEKLGQVPAGIGRTTLAMDLFGRNIQGLGPILGITRAQMDEANKTIDDYGAKNEKAAAQGIAFAESMNVGKVANMGLANVMMDAFGPVLKDIVDEMNLLAKAFIKSYEAGGSAKIILEVLSVGMKVLVTAVEAVGVAFVELWHIAVGALEAIIAPVYALGGALDAVLRGKGISGGVAAFKAQMADMQSSAVGHFRAAKDAGESFLDSQKKLWGAHPGATLPTAGAGNTGDVPGKATKGAADDELQIWEAELQDKKLAEQNFWNDDLAGERDFWIAKLAIIEGQKGATVALEKQRLAEIRTIRQKIFDDSKALANQQRTEELADINASLKASTDAENAKYVLVKDSIAARTQAVQQAARRGEISPGDELAQLEALNAEEVANEREKVNAIYALNLDALRQKEALYAADPVNLKKTQDAEIALAAQQQQQLTQVTAKGEQDRARLEQQAATQAEALWRTRIGTVVSSFGQQMLGLINRTQTWSGAFTALMNSAETAAMNAAGKIVTNWIAGEITKTTASQGQSVIRRTVSAVEALFGIGQQKVAATSNIAASAAAAGAAGVASAAAIPITGWAMAPAAGAMDFAAAMSFAPAIAASAGFDIPAGMNPVVQAHQEEMILPARIANPLRSMIATNTTAANNNSGATPGQAGGGDVHHHWNVQAADAHSFQRMLESNSRGLERAATKAVRRMGGR